MQYLVNPVNFDWQAAGKDTDLDALRNTWTEMLESNTEQCETDKDAGKLNDDLQLLFVSLILDSRATMASCLLYTSPSPRDRTRSRMPSSA